MADSQRMQETSKLVFFRAKRKFIDA